MQLARLTVLSACILASCDGDREVELGECAATGTTQVVVARTMVFGRETEGVSPGFDLDDHVTADGESDGCGIEDYVHPDGTPGIDNALARLLPLLESTEAAALGPYLQEAVNSGELLLLFEVSGIDDPMNDDCVDFSLSRGMGSPLLGTADLLMPGQTFPVDPSVQPIQAKNAAIIDGELRVDNLVIALPIEIVGVQIDLEITGASLSLRDHGDGTWDADIGGAFDYTPILTMLEENPVDAALKAALPVVLEANSDLSSEPGECDLLSITLSATGVSAHLYEPAE